MCVCVCVCVTHTHTHTHTPHMSGGWAVIRKNSMKAQLTSLSHVILSQCSSKPDSNPSPPRCSPVFFLCGTSPDYQVFSHSFSMYIYWAPSECRHRVHSLCSHRAENLVEGRWMLDNHINEKSGAKCYEGQVQRAVRACYTCWWGQGRPLRKWHLKRLAGWVGVC